MKKSFLNVENHINSNTWFCLLIVGALLCGCEGYRTAEGTVVDAENGNPLEGVECFVISSDYSYFTDSTGTFDLGNGMTGCVPECPDIVVLFSKEGFIPSLHRNEEAEGVIQLQRE